MKPTEILTGMFAFSKAGHDKSNIYIIIEETDTHVFLADGRTRTIERPKKKNRRHIQLMKRGIDEELRHRLRQPERPVCNEEIKRAIRLCKQELD